MSPDGYHGTLTGYTRGCRLACCRRARRLHETRRRMDKGRGITYTVSAIGTKRRIYALMCLGWTSESIAKECGYDTANGVTEIMKRDRIHLTTANRFSACYARLSMKLGPSSVTRNRALRAGHAPPLAWDDRDIDDPAAKPYVGRERGNYRADELCQEWDHLRRCGVSLEHAAKQLGVRPAAIEKALERVARRVA